MEWTVDCIGPEKKTFEPKSLIIFLCIVLNMCFRCSKGKNRLTETIICYVLVEEHLYTWRLNI